MKWDLYQKSIYEIIDYRIAVEKEFERLLELSDDNMTFSQNKDRSILCSISYKGYNIKIRLTVDEVYKHALEEQKTSKGSESKSVIERSIYNIIRDKVISELL